MLKMIPSLWKVNNIMQEVVITDYIVRAWLKSLCRMDGKYCGYLDAWEEMSGERIQKCIDFLKKKIEVKP